MDNLLQKIFERLFLTTKIVIMINIKEFLWNPGKSLKIQGFHPYNPGKLSKWVGKYANLSGQSLLNFDVEWVIYVIRCIKNFLNLRRSNIDEINIFYLLRGVLKPPEPPTWTRHCIME